MTRKTAADVIRNLNTRLRQLERATTASPQLRVSSGCAPLDRLLPGAGFATGSLIEWIALLPAGGATSLAMLAARSAQIRARELGQGGEVVVVDRQRVFYPPAAAAWGVDLQRMTIVQPTNDADELWAMDQILRCQHVAVLLAWPQRLDSFTFRRLQLAVEAGGGFGFLIRDAAAQAEPSWADLRLLVSPASTQEVTGPQKSARSRNRPSSAARNSSAALKKAATVCTHGWRLRVEILRCRGRFRGRHLELEIDPQTGAIHETHHGNLATELAHPTSDQHSARA